MNKNNNNFSATIDDITTLLSSGIMSYEGLRQKVEDEMTKKEVETKYGNDIKQMPNGLWWIRLSNGAVIKRTKRENVIQKLIELERANSITEHTLKSLWNSFYAHRRLSQADGTFAKDLRNFNNYIAPTRLAKIPLSKITIDDLDTWVADFLDIRSDMHRATKEKFFGTVKNTVSQMFNYAIQCKIISENPVNNLVVHKDRLAPATVHYDSNDIFLPDEEARTKLLAYKDAKETKISLPLAIPLFYLTGIRDGELCALHWRDINDTQIHVQSEMVEQRNEDGRFIGYRWVDHCKTTAGNRYIPLNSEARHIFAEIKKINLSNGLPIGQDDFVFLRIYKGELTFCTTRCFETRIKKYCKQAQMPVLKSQHDARRTFATNLYYAGMPEKDIQKIMGHSSVEQTRAYIKGKPTSVNVIDYMEKLTERNKSEQHFSDEFEGKKIGNA